MAVSNPDIVEEKPKAAVLRMEGTNNEEEAFQALGRSGAEPRFVHIKELENRKLTLDDFDIIFVPGGFSAGDYIRAGAIFAMRLKKAVLSSMEQFAEEKKPIIGVCNGFQILTEMGLLPFRKSNGRDLTLTVNESNRYECRTTFIRLQSENLIFAKAFSDRIAWEVPVAHSEGRIAFSSDSIIDELAENGQILFKYVDPEGNYSGYPWNPNGSVGNVAAISNEFGNVVGLMPHPERIYFPFQCEVKPKNITTGKAFFDSIVRYSLSLGK